MTFVGMNLSSSSPGTGHRSVLSDVIGGGTGAHAMARDSTASTPTWPTSA